MCTREQQGAASPLARGGLMGLAVLAWIGVLAASVLVLAPHSAAGAWLGTRTVLAQALAFPLLTGAGLVVAGLLGWALVPRRVRPARRAFASAAVVVALLGGILAATPSGPPWASGPAGSARIDGRPLRVAVFNSLDTLTIEDVAHLIDRADPDILVLPEASQERVTAALTGTGFAGGIRPAASDGYSGGPVPWVAPTVVAVHERVGGADPVDVVPTTFGAVQVRLGEGVDVMGVHTAPPVPRLMGRWREDLERLAAVDRAAAGRTLIVAGDMNATLRHGALARRVHLVDAAEQCPGWATGTWPAENPAWLRAPIDHILVTRDVVAVSCSAFEVGASDHLAYAVELRLPAE